MEQQQMQFQRPPFDPLVMFGSIKIVDGLFITDEIAALVSITLTFQDLEFITVNKVKRVINCSGNHSQQIPNHWSSIGIQYITLNWRDEDQLSININAQLCDHLYNFIEECLVQHDSVIVHGIGTQSTTFLVAAIYLMMKFKWTFIKTFDYLVMK